MMELLKSWISTLCVVIVIVSIAHIILPNASIKKHAKFAFSLIILSIMLYPIINLLSFNKGVDIKIFEENVNGTLQEKEDKYSLYDEEIMWKSLEENLEAVLKDEFYENDFEVNLNGKMDLNSMEVNIQNAKIKVVDEKRVKKVEKIIIGEEKVEKEEGKDAFLEKVEKFVEKELKISHENIIVSYS